MELKDAQMTIQKLEEHINELGSIAIAGGIGQAEFGRATGRV